MFPPILTMDNFSIFCCYFEKVSTALNLTI
jgi:hypothetical protein